ncbi:hypothetical protein EUA67_00280 [TM7 phylum sp. oral taxon 352]|jgi:hypothetical protein|nr:hypothetical protein EUA68_03495 [TM7 phylum sp. oral taxon 352]TWP22361.1 hypothetical protein EUA67_00280 [TM7 phylum sp. oral taxon 352]
MPNLMPKTEKKDIREIYDRIPAGIRSMSEAVPYILAELDLTPCDESEGIESNRIAIDVKNISNTLTKRGYGNFEQTEEYDPKSTKIAKHVIDLLVRYPFLWCDRIASKEGASDKEQAEIFDQESCNHQFDDLPGLYGITDIQGQLLRRSVQSFHDYDRLTAGDIENLIREVKQTVKEENESQ